MNSLDLPPRRRMPPDVRDRLRARVAESPPGRVHRLRAPLAVAAGVAVLAAGAMLVPRLTGTDVGRSGSPPPSSTASPDAELVRPPTPVDPDSPEVTEALDRCGAIVAASPRAHEFPPRKEWLPAYGALVNGVLVVPYREHSSNGKPGVCATTETTATISDPSEPPMDLGQPHAKTGDPPYVYSGLLYLPESGVLAGFAQSIHSMEVTVQTSDGAIAPKHTLGNELFVLAVGKLKDGDRIRTEITWEGGPETAELVFDHTKVRPVGATGTDR